LKQKEKQIIFLRISVVTRWLKKGVAALPVRRLLGCEATVMNTENDTVNVDHTFTKNCPRSGGGQTTGHGDRLCDHLIAGSYSMQSDLIGTAETGFELSRTYKVDVPQRRVWEAAVSGRIPAVRQRGRWYVRRGDLPRVAEVLGLAPPPAAPVRPRKTTRSRATVPA
jgi:hypothetical protein